MNNQPNTAGLISALIPRLKLRLAQLGLALAPPPQEQHLMDWLRSLPVPAGAEGPDPITEFGVSLAADMQRLTWRAAGNPDEFIPSMALYLEEVGAAPAEMERLSQAGAQLQPDQLGSWLEVKPDGLNAGWYFPGEWSFDQVQSQVDPGPARQALLEWADEFGPGGVSRLGRAMGEGNPFTELLIPLPQPEDVEEQLYVGLKLFEKLAVQPPPDEALELLLSLEHQGLAVSLWLTAKGVIKAGLLAAQPRLSLTLELCRLAGIENHDPLAAFEGLLGVDGPTYVEGQTRADTFTVETHYNLDRDIGSTLSS